MERTTQQALFQAAVDGDLDAVRALLAQPNVSAEMARSNASHQRSREWAMEYHFSSFDEHVRIPLYRNAWHYYRSRDGLGGSFFGRIIQHGQLHVLDWLMSFAAIGILAGTVLGHLDYLCTMAISHDRVDGIELILESALFLQELTSSERHHVLQEFLHQVIRARRPEILRLDVAHGADVNAVRVTPANHHNQPLEKMESPLSCCATSGNVACLYMLLACGALCEQNHTLGNDTNFGNVELVRALINCGLDTRGDGTSTLLHSACRVRVLGSVEALITTGFTDVNAVTEDGLTSLMAAVIQDEGCNSAFSVVSLLLANGADPHIQSENGENALHILTDGSMDTATLRLFVTHAPQLLNAQDVRGFTPMRTLVEYFSAPKSTKLLDVLLECRADPLICDNNGASTYQVLVRSESGRTYANSHLHYFPLGPSSIAQVMACGTHASENGPFLSFRRRQHALRKSRMDHKTT